MGNLVLILINYICSNFLFSNSGEIYDETVFGRVLFEPR